MRLTRVLLLSPRADNNVPSDRDCGACRCSNIYKLRSEQAQPHPRSRTLAAGAAELLGNWFTHLPAHDRDLVGYLWADFVCGASGKHSFLWSENISGRMRVQRRFCSRAIIAGEETSCSRIIINKLGGNCPNRSSCLVFYTLQKRQPGGINFGKSCRKYKKYLLHVFSLNLFMKSIKKYKLFAISKQSKIGVGDAINFRDLQKTNFATKKNATIVLCLGVYKILISLIETSKTQFSLTVLYLFRLQRER